MFLGAIPRRPDKATAYKELKKHLTMLGVWVAIIRATPYVAHFLSKDKDNELKLEF
ncbi:mitochondrial import receptor subunit TOM6 homolog [Cryptomeria japonica]|uniref:mitochondrial import receptor subunit TOM6 homolog n=1 Tax=Cryptomeria japonica TaxID=3369 RepID=UPI0025AD5F59|nr:mitochondrial import receptor subunit TOM6 homolog [Cryptomeria japonica]